MPAVPSGLVLVTGASGFIAAHVVKELLDNGFRVRGTVRSKEKGEYLVKKFPGQTFEYTIVEDLEKKFGFDEAAQGVDAIVHTAGPFTFNVTDPIKDLINPSVIGTRSVLESAQKNGDKVKRIVMLSSIASIEDSRFRPVHIFTEKDWNENSPAEYEKMGKDVDLVNAYCASKTLAEKAAWKFIEDENPSFDLVTLCPSFALGPVEHHIPKPESMNFSVANWYGFLSGQRSGDDAQGPYAKVVDSRDLAKAFVLAISCAEGAGNNRFGIANQAFSWQDCLDIANDKDEIKKAFPKLPVGKKGSGAGAKQNLLDNTKSKQILKLKYTSLEKTIVDMSLSLAERERSGWSESY